MFLTQITREKHKTITLTEFYRFLHEKLKIISFSSSEGHFEVIFSQNVFNLQKENRIENLFA